MTFHLLGKCGRFGCTPNKVMMMILTASHITVLKYQLTAVVKLKNVNITTLAEYFKFSIQ